MTLLAIFSFFSVGAMSDKYLYSLAGSFAPVLRCRTPHIALLYSGTCALSWHKITAPFLHTYLSDFTLADTQAFRTSARRGYLRSKVHRTFPPSNGRRSLDNLEKVQISSKIDSFYEDGTFRSRLNV